MEMINRCLEITDAKRAEVEEFDRRHAKRKEMIAMRRERRDALGWTGSRKERRRLAALERHGKETV